jgi:ABC-type uncharacterized transport system substrate-binding protein
MMLSITTRILGFLAIFIWALPSMAQHSHGKGTLQLSLQSDVLQGQWTMPMEALLGFEQLPKNPSQTESMNQLQKSLQNANYFIELPAEAKCQQIEVKAESDMFQGVKGKGHSDLQYVFKFKCAQPQALTKCGFPFFKSHLRAHQLKVEWVSQGSQKSATVRSSKPTFAP